MVFETEGGLWIIEFHEYGPHYRVSTSLASLTLLPLVSLLFRICTYIHHVLYLGYTIFGTWSPQLYSLLKLPLLCKLRNVLQTWVLHVHHERFTICECLNVMNAEFVADGHRMMHASFLPFESLCAFYLNLGRAYCKLHSIHCLKSNLCPIGF